jgi:hypothetical protein
LKSVGVNVTDRIINLKRTLKIIIQIVKWLYDLDRLNRNVSPETFAAEYMIQDDTIGDSSDYYDLSKIQRKLPVVKTPAEGIAALTPIAPTLFNGGRIVMYSPDFTDKIIKMLNDYNNANFGIQPEPIKYIEDYYSNDRDFEQQNNVVVFSNERDFAAWKYSNTKDSKRSFDIMESINTDKPPMQPYIFKNSDGAIYLVQNVLDGKKSRAMNVAFNWFTERINLGSRAPDSDQEWIHLVYRVTPDGTLIPMEDNTAGNEKYLKLINYVPYGQKEGRYGALLELL